METSPPEIGLDVFLLQVTATSDKAKLEVRRHVRSDGNHIDPLALPVLHLSKPLYRSLAGFVHGVGGFSAVISQIKAKLLAGRRSLLPFIAVGGNRCGWRGR
jgi:hypothetical protein